MTRREHAVGSDSVRDSIDALLRKHVGSEIIDARSVSHLEGTREAEDLHGILRDLEYVKRAIEELDDMIRHEDEGHLAPGNAPIVRRSLYTGALIAYARCYGKPSRKESAKPGKKSGKRTLLDADEVFAGTDPSWRRHHDHFVNVRDKHLAHSVNSFEINLAGLFVEDWDADPPKHTVGILSFHRESETAGNVLALARLAEIATECTYERQGALLEKLHAQITSMPIDAQRALEPLEVEFRQGTDDVSGPRR